MSTLAYVFSPRTTGGTRRLVFAALIAAVLAAPLIAMQFTREVAWTGSDFVAALVLLGSGALAFELAASLLATRAQRLAVGGAIALVVLLAWAQGAVGIV